MNYIQELKRIREDIHQVVVHIALYNPEIFGVSGLRIELDKIILDLENRENNHETKN